MITLKADLQNAIGAIGNDEKWNDISPWMRTTLLSDWIEQLQKLKLDARTDEKIFSSWVVFKENNNLTGLAKVFLDEARFINVANKILEVEIPVRPLAVAMPQVRSAFQELCGIKNLVLKVRVSPNTQ